MTAPTFVDTNVWAYAYDARAGAKRSRAREVLTADPGSLWVSAQVMGELYVTLTRKGAPPMDRTAARSIIGGLARLNVAPLEAATVLEALEIARDGQVSYWDALIVATARGAGCLRVLTEDLAHESTIAGIRIENPFADGRPRLAEERAAYGAPRAHWDDQDLREGLARYEAEARASGMMPSAVHSYWDYARRFLDWREGIYPRGAVTRPVPTRRLLIGDLREDLASYERWLTDAGLTQAAVDTYVRHADFFVRWLGGDFQPGARLRRRRR